MNRIVLIAREAGLAAMLIGCTLIGSAWAAESNSIWTRQTFDLVMRWVNFLILAIVVFKYGRKPILQFLDTQKTTVAQSITKLEEQKQQVEAQVAQNQRQLVDNQERLTRIRKRIIAEGQACRDQTIAEAQHDARILLEAAKRKIEGQMQTAHSNLKAELVDMAADLTISRLPAIITPVDQSRLIERWFEFQEVQDRV